VIVSGGTPYLAIVPARIGSKRIFHKNIRELASRPLVSWTIEHVRQCATPMRVVVSTDDAGIRELCLKAGAEVPLLRPAELARDDTPMESVLHHVLETLPRVEEIEKIVLLPPTSPVRDDGSLDAAVELYETSGADSLVSVSEISPLIWSGTEADPVALYDLYSRPRQQEVPEGMRRFIENGSIVITSITSLRASRLRIGGQCVMFIMRAHEALDLDDEYDLWLAEQWLEHQEGSNRRDPRKPEGVA
jgi:CMP-N,N'-diacetyllegionaminic acid synthase